MPRLNLSRPRLVHLSPALLALLACTRNPAQPASDAADEQPQQGDALVRDVPTAPGEALVFPPVATGRHARPDLDIDGAREATTEGDKLEVRWPSLDAEGNFEVEGQRVRISLSGPAMAPGKFGNGKGKGKPIPAAPGTLTIEPAVAGKAVWTSPYSLEFAADEPFDPDTTYTITVAGLATEAGLKLEKPWVAKFTAEPRIEIAGKTITYLPEPGKPGVINLFPMWGRKLSPGAKLYVVFDQAVDLKRAPEWISLTNTATGAAIDVRLSHLKGARLDGYTVDPKQVVEVRPAAPLEENIEVTLRAEGPSDDDAEVTQTYSIAGALELVKVGCGYAWDRSVCEWSGPKLRTDGREIALEFTNRLAVDDKALKAAVRVTPAVENLGVWANDTYDSQGRVVVSGNFKPSTTYKVSLPALKDVYGNTVPPTSITVDTTPLAASVSMPEGVLILDAAASRAFTVTTRNVGRGELHAWEVAGTDAAALDQARGQVESHKAPEGEPTAKIAFFPQGEADAFVQTPVDLLSQLKPGKSYVVAIKLIDPTHGAQPTQYPSWMSAARDPLALVTPGDDQALAVHTHVLPDVTLVHVARLASGEPVSGASFSLNGAPVAGRTTDANGFAVLPVGLDRAGATALRAEASGAAITVPLKAPSSENRLFPELSAEAAPLLGDRRAMVITDRGIYRPGATVHVKASVRQRVGAEVVPLAGKPVVVRVIGPTDEELANFALVTDDMGSVAADWAVPAESRLGRHRLVVSEAADAGKELDEAVVQVAEFEPPRFTVDVDASASKNVLSAKVLGKYLFGAPMDRAAVEWTLSREAARLPSGPFTDAGFRFTEMEDWWYEEEGEGDGWSRAGSGTLGADGTLQVSQKLDMSGAVGPQAFTFEADVADTSYRHIAGRSTVVVHPAPRYAGVKIERPWSDIGVAVPVQLGVIDQEGQPVEGATVTARLVSVDWTYSRRPMKGGGYDYQWQRTTKEVGSCTATSGRSPASCDLTPPESGSYEVHAAVDGRAGGVTSLWAWGHGGKKPVVPSKGRTVEITPDKARYAPGETARLLVRNPFPSATAIFTLEQGGLLSHQVVRLDEAAQVFEVPIQAGHAPYVHATVTLLPIDAGEQRTEWKLGALRIPVALDDVRLQTTVKSDREVYEPREEVEISVDVVDKGRPVAGAEVALAVVDEGVLRMTNFHAADPVTELRPGQPLSFEVSDSRDRLAALLKHSQTAGDGDGSASVTNTRKNFVQTAFWKPDLRTDAKGRATVKFTLPDNLTRFRMMAVVVDKQGKGGSVEGEFTVRRPVMMVPVVPRFAAVGDSFEAAAMLHNNTDAPLVATVAMNDASQQLTVPPQGHQRVGFPLDARAPGPLKLDFTVRDGSAVRDAVEAVVPVDVPGVSERPHLSGAFVGAQQVSLEVPAGVLVGRGDRDYVTVQVGQHLWPELGARLQFLLDFPHGCVEQTTSSTLPLLAARDIFPRIGFTGMAREEIDKRIVAGLQRLASMRTASGGLGYWPGDSTPNVYGTAYAARAIVAAKQAGIALPAGLLEGLTAYLSDTLLSDGIEAEVQAAIAQTLGELGELPESAADPLFDRKQHMGVFGLASLAIALNSLKGQEDRVAQLLDEVEAGFDADGALVKPPGSNDFYYFGSNTRTRAQAAIALGRLRPASTLKVKLVQQLANATEGYTTQSTAYSLMSIAEQLKSQPAGGAAVTVLLDGAALVPAQELGEGAQEYRIPLADLRDKKARLELRSDSKSAIAFIVQGAWRRALENASGLVATSAKKGPDIYRVITDARGEAVDYNAIKAGQVLRVALLADLPIGDLGSEEMNYLAVTDRLPAGFEPIQPDLWTVARAPEVSDAHPFASALRYGGSDASYVELRDDRVYIYFDRVWGERVVASYLVRASTPGRFALPPAAAEFMYVGDSLGYSTAGKVEVKP